MRTQEIITKENCAVVITNQDGAIWANFFVNARNGIQDAIITPTRWTGKTMTGARRWAHKKLEAHYA